MKKTLLMLIVLALAVPTMAAVSIDVNDLGNGWAAIEYTTDSNVSAFGLKVTVSGANTITEVNNFHIGESNSTAKGYGIFLGNPGGIQIVGGVPTAYGDPIAPNTDPGASGTGLDTNTVILELGALYEDGNQPPLSGKLCELKVSGCCTMSVVGDSTRCGEVGEVAAGAVLEGGNTSVVVDVTGATDVQIDYSCGPPPCATCKGDLAGNNWIMLADLSIMIGKLNAKGPPYMIGPTDPLYVDCGDMNGDSWIMLADLSMLVGKLNAAGPPYQIPCP